MLPNKLNRPLTIQKTDVPKSYKILKKGEFLVSIIKLGILTVN